MHPNTFYSTLFEHEKRDEVFVAMSFAPEFDARWRDVIDPTIREDLKLRPNRVDYNRGGESIVHDMLDGIAHAKLVIADITSIHMIDQRGRRLAPTQRQRHVGGRSGPRHAAAG